MSRALRRATETNESIYVQLYPRGFQAALDSVQVPVVEDILLFSQPGTRFESSQVFLAPFPRFSYTQTLTIQDLPAISHVGWRDASQTGGTITTTAGVYYVRPVSQYWLELYGARIAKGRFFSAQDSSGRVVILGSQARQGLFGDGAVLGKEIASADVRDKYPCQVVGVLEPFGPAYGPLAAGYDQFIFLLDTDDWEGYLTHEILVRPKPGQSQQAMEQVRQYVAQEFGKDAEVSLIPMKVLVRIFSGLQGHQFFLLRYVWAVVLMLVVAALNISAAVYALLWQMRFSIGVRRSLGASRRVLLAGIFWKALLRGLVTGAAGVGGSLLMTPILLQAINRCLSSWWCEEPVPVTVGWITLAGGLGLGVLLWGLSSALPAVFFLRRSPAELLREGYASLGQSRRFKTLGVTGFALGVTMLLVLLGLRDGTGARLDHILGWAGGERAGAFVNWYEASGLSSSSNFLPTVLMNGDYEFLRDRFPGVNVGWLGKKGSFNANPILDASASMAALRPAPLAAGRWITAAEENTKASVVILGPDLARQEAERYGVAVKQLIGKRWENRKIVGVMAEWPVLRSMGYYPDVGYVPVNAYLDGDPIWSPTGQVPFVIPPSLDFEATLAQMQAALVEQHPGTEPQVLLPVKKLGDLLTWRFRTYTFLGLFAAFCLVIGGVGVMNQVFLWVISRWREIGIRRSVGATQRDIAGMILKQTLSLTLLAAALGGVIGTVAAMLVQRSQGWPITVYPYWLIAVLGMALLAAVVFGSLPAWWAATRPPTEALRME